MKSSEDENPLIKRRSLGTITLLRFLRKQPSPEEVEKPEQQKVNRVIGNLKGYVKDRGEKLYGAWDYLIIVLSILSVGMILIQLDNELDYEFVKLFELFDNIFCGIFFVDFIIRLSTAVSKRQYLKWGWIDLISSLPMLDQLRWGRLLRLMRIIRAIKGALRGHQKIERRIEDPLISVVIISFLCVFLGALSVLYLESNVEGANIKTARDAIWWALVTVTTVGYGDFTPITNEGRILAVLLMSSGIGVFGIFSVQCTQYLLKARQKNEDEELQSVKNELFSLRQEIKELKSMIQATLEETDHADEDPSSTSFKSTALSKVKVTKHKNKNQRRK